MSDPTDPSPSSSAFWLPVESSSRRGKKVRADAVLKNLGTAAQRLIVQWCKKPMDRDEDGNAIKGTGGVEYALDQLSSVAVSCSLPALAVSHDTLYKFLQWYQLEQDLETSADVEEQVLAKTGNKQAAREAGETLLLRLGVARQDADLIMAAARVSDSRRSLDLKEESGRTKAKLKLKDLELAERRVAVLEAKLAEIKTAVDNKALTDEERARRIAEIYGRA